jgi:hypothetical protein
MLPHFESGQLRQGATARTMLTYLSSSLSSSSSSSDATGRSFFGDGLAVADKDDGEVLGTTDVCFGPVVGWPAPWRGN